jgi:hypothetical protein
MRTFLFISSLNILFFATGSAGRAAEVEPRPVLMTTAPTTVGVAARLPTFTGLEEQALPAMCQDVDAKEWAPKVRQTVIQPNGKNIRYEVLVEPGFSHFSDVYLVCLEKLSSKFYYPARAICDKPGDFVNRLALTFNGQKRTYFVCSSDPSNLTKLAASPEQLTVSPPPTDAPALTHAADVPDASSMTD